jgi:2-polyprenyl-3-methyl-5-hydroxy-6-metoxy-1,4-benzoquinol methylase
MSGNKLIDYYDEEKWGEDILTKDELFDREKKAIKLIESISIDKAKFLDIGSGVGFFMKKLSQIKPKFDMHGVDYSSYNLKKAKKLPFTFRQCNIEEGIPYKDKTFDVVYAGELIEHLVNPDFFVQECARLIKKGGHVIITTPNLCAWYNRILVAVGNMPMFYELSTVSPKIGAGSMKKIKQGTIPVGHIRIFTIRALKDLLEKEGFDIVSVKGAHFAALPKAVRWIDDIFTVYPRLSSGMLVMARKK